MRKMLTMVALFGIVLISGCNRDAMSSSTCRESVMKEFPNAQITNEEDKKYVFLVKTVDGSVWRVETLSTNDASITKRTKLFN